jgi:tetraacyldisaccharide 4'-kinase
VTPRFWGRPADRPGPLARALLPLARVLRPAPPPDWPGGARLIQIVPVHGEETALALAQTLALELAGRRLQPHLVLPGKLPGARRVDPARDGPEAAGAAALLLSAFAPVWTGGAAAAAHAVAEGARCLIAIPALPARGAALTFLAAGPAGLGNGLPRPAGPLPLPAAELLGAADALVLDAAARRDDPLQGLHLPCPVLAAKTMPLPTGMDWHALPVLAFTSSAEPATFFAALDRLGAKTLRRVTFDARAGLAPGLATRLQREAALRGAQMVTTERDAVRLPAGMRRKVLTLPLRLEITDRDGLEAILGAAGFSAR